MSGRTVQFSTPFWHHWHECEPVNVLPGKMPCSDKQLPEVLVQLPWSICRAHDGSWVHNLIIILYPCCKQYQDDAEV